MSATVGPVPVGTVAGVWPQPDAVVALQMLPSITDMVSPDPSANGPLSGTYTVSVASSTVGKAGPGPAAIRVGRCAQPVVVARLHADASITETKSNTLPT